MIFNIINKKDEYPTDFSRSNLYSQIPKITSDNYNNYNSIGRVEQPSLNQQNPFENVFKNMNGENMLPYYYMLLNQVNYQDLLQRCMYQGLLSGQTPYK